VSGRKISPVRFLLLSIPLSLLGQQLAHEAGVVNIEVPVRVYQGGRFVDSLTLADFEITEDGVPQTPLAVYLIKKTAIAKREVKAAEFRPRVEKRNFLLLFECNDYVPELSRAIDDFFGHVLASGDSLMVITPLKSYDFKDEAFARLPKEKIVAQLKSLLKRDIGRASLAYRALLRDVKDSGMSRSLMLQLLKLKMLSLPGFMSAADYLKALEGQKFVFLFYQKETIPIPDLDDLEVFEYGDTEGLSFDLIKRTFSDASISTHFIYLTKGMADIETGERPTMDNILESATPIFRAFRDLTVTTGGIVDVTYNAQAGMKMASDASENYYLLYYSPSRYAKDGSYKTINVSIKGGKYKVYHRTGYIAD
jgi:hypothetical protein